MSIVAKQFGKIIVEGTVKLIDGTGREHLLGQRVLNRPNVTVKIKDKATEIAMALSRNGSAEAYVDGRIEVLEGSVLDLVDLIKYNTRWDYSNGLSGALNSQSNWLLSMVRQINWPALSRKNVASHYDLDESIFGLFLDKERQYSAAYHEHPSQPLPEAELNKKELLAAKLCLRSGQRVLDIGCGWGSLAIYLHRMYGVHVTGITLSEEQVLYARARVKALGIEDYVKFELCDYRLVNGKFDRIVAVEMMEHVGRAQYSTFYATARDLLTDDGVLLVQTSGCASLPTAPGAWMEKHIFPGGSFPSLSDMVKAVERSEMWVTDVEVLRLHYAYTIEQWYAQLQENRSAFIDRFGNRFFRTWELYLAICIAMFKHDARATYHIQVSRRNDTVPVLRSYIDKEITRLRTKRSVSQSSDE